MATSFFGQLFGFYMIIIGCSFLFNKDSFIDSIVEISKHRGMLLVTGLFTTLVGLFFVLSHNVWDHGSFALIVTLFAWAVFLKGLSIVFLPQRTVALWTKWSDMKHLWYVYGFMTLVLGLYFVYGGRM